MSWPSGAKGTAILIVLNVAILVGAKWIGILVPAMFWLAYMIVIGVVAAATFFVVLRRPSYHNWALAIGIVLAADGMSWFSMACVERLLGGPHDVGFLLGLGIFQIGLPELIVGSLVVSAWSKLNG